MSSSVSFAASSLAAFVVLANAACGADDKQPILPPPPPTAQPTASVAPPIDTSPAPPVAPTKPSMAEMQVQAAKSIADAASAHDAKKLAGAYANEAVVTVYGVGVLSGRDAVVADTQRWLDGFGDLKFQVGRIFQKSDMAVVEWAWTGTHTGEFMGMKATQRPIGVQGASVVWFNADGLVTKEHRYFDVTTILAQDDPKAKKDAFRPPPALPSNVETHVSKGGADEEKLAEIVRSMHAAVEAKKEAELLAFFTDDTAIDDYAQPKTTKGKKDAKAMLASFTSTFRDAKIANDAIFAADDFVISESKIDATHAATKKKVTLHYVDIFQIKDGKTIAKGASYTNAKELADQLRIQVAAVQTAPAKPAAPPKSR